LRRTAPRWAHNEKGFDHMADFDNQVLRGRGTTADVALDQGLRTYMIGVYQYMMLAIALTGAVAWVVSMQTGLIEAILSSRLLLFLVALAPVPVSIYLQVRIANLSAGAAQGLFWLYSAMMGVWFGILLSIFTDESFVRVFLITAAAFGALSLYGYTTKRSLSGLGSFLMMGMAGLFIATLFAWIFPTAMFINIICVIGVLIFAGLTAYDTQQIKEMYFEGDSSEMAQRKSILGALWLYISFTAIFQYLLQLLGDRE
jgi:FtsH-binding integral membrane protein